jgi:hypothetical protein
MTERTSRYLVAAVCALTFVLAMFRFDGPAKGYWDTYITAPAMFMNKVPVKFVLKDGSPAFNPKLEGRLPHDLVDKDDFGIITKDQRLGPGITASFEYAFFGQLGFRLLYAMAFTLIIPLCVLATREVFPKFGVIPGLLGGIALTWNPYLFNVDRLNANLFSMPLILLVLYLMLRPKRNIVLIGLMFGVLAGIRNEAVCFVPAICYWMLRQNTDQPFFKGFPRRFGELFVVGALTVVALGPIFYWKWYAFGNPLMHPSQYSHFQGFRPEFLHSFFGKEFTFNGLFNWPFHTKLVRTPHFGYPTYLLFPLVTARALGLVICALLLNGTWVLWRKHRAVLIMLVVWMAPVYVLFGPQENWEEVKMTFMLLAWPPLGLFIAAGLTPFADTLALKTNLVRVAALAVVVFAVVAGLSSVHAPQDERWYVRFPNADKAKNPAAQEGLAETARNEWTYFQSYETEAEIARERDKLSTVWPWPATYLPVTWDFGREWIEMKDEAGKEELVVLEIWGYIYGASR